MTSERQGTCEWCGEVFIAPFARGPVPKFCRRSHRQRAFEAAQQTPTTSPSPSPPDADVDRSLATLRAKLDQPVDIADAKRPTVLAPLLAELIETIEAVMRSVRYDPDDLDTVRIFVVAGDVVEHLYAQQLVLDNHPRSAPKLASAIAEAERIGRALLDPAAMGQRARFGHGRLLRVAVPGPDRLLPPGVIEVDFDKSGHREVRWYPLYESIHNGALLHRVARRRNEAHRFGDADDWANLARDMIIVCTGWITSALPMPTSLDQRATRELGNQLLRQFRNGPWSVTSTEIVDWLDGCGYISVVGDTAISDQPSKPYKPQ